MTSSEISDFHLLSDNADALLARLELAASAKQSLDIQYYIFHNDASGNLIAHHLFDAADRGVQVRILVDDINLSGKDAALKQFDGHPNIEIRIFNPLTQRVLFRNFELIFNLNKAGRRMHNKAFISDNEVAIIGGRNIGDEYFDDRTELSFLDLDLIVAGGIVENITDSFNDFWYSRWSTPISEISRIKVITRHISSLRRRLKDYWHKSLNSEYFQAIRHAGFVQDLLGNRLEFIIAHAWLYYDKPEKISSEEPNPTLHMGPHLQTYLGTAKHEIIMCTPYFVPGADRMHIVDDLAKRAVSVKVLTNSLASTDVTAAHAGYAKYRKPLLDRNIKLYELKPGAKKRRKLLAKFKPRRTRASLHAKYLVIDKRYVFIGSSNFDPRSANLNTEIGMLIDSQKLAEQVIDLFNLSIQPENCYHIIKHDGSGKPAWSTMEQGVEKICYSEPESTIFRRLLVRIISLFPIESLL